MTRSKGSETIVLSNAVFSSVSLFAQCFRWSSIITKHEVLVFGDYTMDCDGWWLPIQS